MSKTNQQHKNTTTSLPSAGMQYLPTSVTARGGVEGRADKPEELGLLFSLLPKGQEEWERCQCVPLAPNLISNKTHSTFLSSKSCCYQPDILGLTRCCCKQQEHAHFVTTDSPLYKTTMQAPFAQSYFWRQWNSPNTWSFHFLVVMFLQLCEDVINV